MKYTVLLNVDENKKQVETEEQFKFVKSIMEALEIPINWNFEEPSSFSIEDKKKFRNTLEQFGIQVIDDRDGIVTIYHEKEKIAEWSKCQYKLKRDYSQINPMKRLYVEMSVNFWSIFEQPNDE